MTVSADGAVSDIEHIRYDPWDVELNTDPYPMFSRIREHAPLYYNTEHDFFALSRFSDVDAALLDHETFSSARGAVLEIIKSGTGSGNGTSTSPAPSSARPRPCAAGNRCPPSSHDPAFFASDETYCVAGN